MIGAVFKAGDQRRLRDPVGIRPQGDRVGPQAIFLGRRKLFRSVGKFRIVADKIGHLVLGDASKFELDR